MINTVASSDFPKPVPKGTMTFASGSERIHLSFDPNLQGKEGKVRFRLTYEGELKHNGGVDHIHHIRQQFHPQLRRVWEVNPFLKANERARPEYSRTQALADNYKRGAYRFVPMASHIRQSNDPPDLPVVSLDILFLRSGPPGGLKGSGDVDNRLGTLFDALRMPSGAQEFGQNVSPGPDEDPFFVLMDDDKLVGNVSITTDTLLQPTPGMETYSKHDARVVIAVEITSFIALTYYP